LKHSQVLAIGIRGVEHGDETLRVVMFCADECGVQTDILPTNVGGDILQLVMIISEMSGVLSKKGFQRFYDRR
jgi:hypothetical protein